MKWGMGVYKSARDLFLKTEQLLLAQLALDSETENSQVRQAREKWRQQCIWHSVFHV